MNDEKVLSEYLNKVIPNDITFKYETEKVKSEIKTFQDKIKIREAYLKDLIELKDKQIKK